MRVQPRPELLPAQSPVPRSSHRAASIPEQTRGRLRPPPAAHSSPRLGQHPDSGSGWTSPSDGSPAHPDPACGRVQLWGQLSGQSQGQQLLLLLARPGHISCHSGQADGPAHPGRHTVAAAVDLEAWETAGVFGLCWATHRTLQLMQQNLSDLPLVTVPWRLRRSSEAEGSWGEGQNQATVIGHPTSRLVLEEPRGSWEVSAHCVPSTTAQGSKGQKQLGGAYTDEHHPAAEWNGMWPTEEGLLTQAALERDGGAHHRGPVRGSASH